ncbi:MAG: uncharacterized protein QOJ39_2858 [Candidatus Eremiobacteraeota bacterium]|jgi:uncharacterized protein YqjF (DUF2071 family)|nr:uncharacterized protein [Candidatus Eremiobacteraeota bacterium]
MTRTGWRIAMDWVDAVFLHWPVPAGSLRSRIPAGLELDTFDGAAWVSIVAFHIVRAHHRGVPPALAWRSFPEINVRTYVRDGERAGVWFFSLDAGSRVAVELGRRVLHLPYCRASIASAFEPGRMSYHLERTDARAPAGCFIAHAAYAGDARTAAPGTLEHWLVERYCFFTVNRRGRTLRGDVAHDPWPLRDATVRVNENSLLEAAGIAPSTSAAIAHVSSGVATRAWPLQTAATPHLTASTVSDM